MNTGKTTATVLESFVLSNEGYLTDQGQTFYARALARKKGEAAGGSGASSASAKAQPRAGSARARAGSARKRSSSKPREAREAGKARTRARRELQGDGSSPGEGYGLNGSAQDRFDIDARDRALNSDLYGQFEWDPEASHTVFGAFADPDRLDQDIYGPKPFGDNSHEEMEQWTREHLEKCQMVAQLTDAQVDHFDSLIGTITYSPKYFPAGCQWPPGFEDGPDMLEVEHRPFEACSNPNCQNTINSRIAKGDESMKASNIVYLDRMSINPACSVCGVPPGYCSSLFCEAYTPSPHTGGKDADGEPVIRYRTIPYYKMLALECAGILVGLHPTGADPGTVRAVYGKEPEQRIGLDLADDQGEPLPKYKVSDLGKGAASGSAGVASAESKNSVRIVSAGGDSEVICTTKAGFQIGAKRAHSADAASGSRGAGGKTASPGPAAKKVAPPAPAFGAPQAKKARVSPVAGYTGQPPKPQPARTPVPDPTPPAGAAQGCGSKPISEYALTQAKYEKPKEEEHSDPTAAELQGIGLLHEKGLLPIEGNRDYKEAVRLAENYIESGKLGGLPVGKPIPDMPPDPVEMRVMKLQHLQVVGTHVVENGLWQRKTIKARPLPPDVTVGGYDLSLIHISEPTRPY